MYDVELPRLWYQYLTTFLGSPFLCLTIIRIKLNLKIVSYLTSSSDGTLCFSMNPSWQRRVLSPDTPKTFG